MKTLNIQPSFNQVLIDFNDTVIYQIVCVLSALKFIDISYQNISKMSYLCNSKFLYCSYMPTFKAT